MEKLKTIHKEIKNHIFRLTNNEEDKGEYCNLLRNLADEIYNVLKEDKTWEKYRHSFNYWLHEINSNIGSFRRNDRRNPDIIFTLETFISTIHNYILTKKIDRFHTYYNGKINSYGNSRFHYLTNEGYIPEYTEEQLKALYEVYKSSSDNERRLKYFEELKENQKLIKK